jgi:hypothetical protein
MDLKQYIAENACPIKFDSVGGYTPHVLLRRKLDFDVWLPEYNANLQRELVWDLERKQELVKSILVGRNIPDVFVIIKNFTEDNECFEVIDGKQRLTTILSFLRDGFPILVGSENKLFSELDADFQYAIKFFPFTFRIAYDSKEITDLKKWEAYKFFAKAGVEQNNLHLNRF